LTSLSSKPKLYLASPLFNELERERNQIIKNVLMEHFDVFLPQEDGLLLHELIINGAPLKEAEKSVYETDVLAMKNSDILLVVLDGASIDDGVAFELGYSKAMNKVCIGLQTDVRRQLPSGNNPMIECSCDEIFNDFESLKKWLILNHTGTNN